VAELAWSGSRKESGRTAKIRKKTKRKKTYYENEANENLSDGSRKSLKGEGDIKKRGKKREGKGLYAR